jgi:hypothetical protein
VLASRRGARIGIAELVREAVRDLFTPSASLLG